MNSPHTPRNPQPATRLALLLILLLAAYLRLNHLEWTEFKLDEAHLSQLAYDMARHGQIPLTGIGSSVGIVNPPLAAWLLAIPYTVSASPIVATGFIAALNGLAVLACYGLARKLFAASGNRAWIAALAVTLLFAASPWAIIHSRKVWAQDLLPPLVMLWAWFGYRAFIEGKRWSLIGHGLLLAAAIQLHYSALYLIPVSAVWLLAFARRVQWQAVAATGLIFVAAFAPFLIAEAGRGWPSVTRLTAMLQQPITVDDSTLHLAWITTIGQEIHSLAGPQEFENYRAQIIPADGLLMIEGALVIGGLLLALIDVARALLLSLTPGPSPENEQQFSGEGRRPLPLSRNHLFDFGRGGRGVRLSSYVRSLINRAWSPRGAIGGWLAAWLIAPIVTQIGHRTPVYPHYFIILYPVQFLLIGWLIARSPKWPRVIVIGAVLLVAFVQTQHTLVLQSFLASRPTPGGAGLPIGYYETIVREAQQALQDRGAAEIIINTRGSDPAVDEYPAVFAFLLNETPHRFVDVTQAARLFPGEANIQIDFTPPPLSPPSNGGDRGGGGRVALRAGERAVEIYAVASYASSGSAPLARWANGVDVLGMKVMRARPGQTATVEVVVRLDEVSAADYHWTNQLFDAHDQRWAQVDAAGYPARYWRRGDIVGYQFSLELPGDLPAGDYVLRLGQYTFPDVATVPVIDVAGLPQADAFEYRVRVEP